jgi:hypothetical protein
MFTFEIRINGSLIGHIYGHNEARSDKEGRTEYSYEYYDVENRQTHKGTVFHRRNDGIRPLVTKILNDVDE